MTFIIKKISSAFLVLLVIVGVVAPSATALAATFNNDSRDYATLQVSNYTRIQLRIRKRRRSSQLPRVLPQHRIRYGKQYPHPRETSVGNVYEFVHPGRCLGK
ncbi:MAG: hypothetical protein UX49_C0014G0003 [Candidatus Wolfebacteria bacterium GW2011_GWC2_46_275]|nr:MAG: hypothetical protein UX49_C0014G0003 [Candidatus Wolfebacteria bacterium GW2011_GWC2_46_275]